MTVTREQRWEEAKSRALRTLRDQPRNETRWSIAWQRQRSIAEGPLDEKQRRVLAAVRAQRFAKELENALQRVRQAADGQAAAA